MNKIFKVIWNHTTQSWVAVSELTSAKGKTKSKTAAKLTALSLVAGSALMAGNALAATATATITSGVPTTNNNANFAIATNGAASVSASVAGTSTPKNVVYIGDGSAPTGIGDEYILIGNGFTGSSAGNVGDTLIGNRIRSGGGGQDSMATAVGYGAQVSGPSVSIGIGSSTDIGDSNGAAAVAQGAVGIGSFARTSGSANGGVAVGTITSADQTNSTAIGTLAGVTTLGYDREPGGSGGGGVLLRLGEANGDTLTSIGAKAGARTTGGIALGSNATTSRISSNNAIAIGTNSAAIKEGSIALGNEALGGGYTSRDQTTLTSNQTSYQNITNTQRTRLLEKVVKANANPTAENKFELASALAFLDRAQLATNRATVDLTQIVATGNANTANAIAFGNHARAVNTNAQAMGAGSIASGASSVATGFSARALGENAIANGNGAIAGMTKDNSGTYDDYLAAANTLTTAANRLATANDSYNYTLGNLNSAASTALTNSGVNVNDMDAVAALTDSNLSGLANAARAVVNAKNNLATAQTAFNTAKTKAEALASTSNAIAQGTDAIASGAGSIAQGVNANASAENAVAIGNTAIASVANGVALGASSEASIEAREGFNPTGQSASLTGVNNGANDTRSNTYAGLADNVLTATLAGVSVGSDSNTRQINHVAAGTADDDAVNVAQLRSVNLKIAGNTSGQTDSAKGTNYDSSTATSKDNVLLDSQTLKVVSSNTDLLTTDATDNTITITPNAQKIVEAAQNPVVYTDSNGNKLIKGDDGKFYPEGSVKIGDTYYPAGTTAETASTATPATATEAGDVIASMNSGSNRSTTPMTLANVKSNLPSVNDTTKIITNPDGTTVAAADVNITKAPLTAAEAATLVANSGNNAATLSDVLSAGWNLQNNGSAVDFVKPYDTVNFVNGGNTKAVATTDDNLTSNVQINVTGLPISYTNAAGVPVTKVGDKYYTVDENGNPTTTEVDPTDLVTNLVNPSNAGSNAIGSATQLGNVAAGANTVAYDASGNPLVKIGNNYYLASDVTNGVPNSGATTQTVATPTDAVKAATAGLADLTNSNQTNALTVADAQNMGWVVSTDNTLTNKKTGASTLDTAYADAVKNTNQVHFQGTGLATVSGSTIDGVRTINVDVDAQAVANAIQNPVVYTNAEGAKLIKGTDGNFYPDDSVLINGKYYPAGTVTDSKGNPVDANGEAVTALTPTVAGDVIASMNDGSNSSTTPMTLANVKSNLPSVNDTTKIITNPDGTTVAATDVNITKAPLTAAQAATLVANSGNNAATLSDVLSAGWNLQNNGSAVDFVKPYDTVNFVNGGNTKAVATTDDNLTSNVQINVTGLPISYTNAAGVPVTKVGDKYYTVDENGNPTTTEVAAGDLTTNLVNPANAGTNSTGNATQLGNVAAGANTIAYDAEGNQLVKIGDNYYNPSDVTNGKPNAGAATQTAVTPTEAGQAATAGLADLTNSNPTNALTVADARNMGWVVSTSDNKYAADVRNTNKVDFKGGDGIEVTGKTTDAGVREITVAIKKGTISNNDSGDTSGTTGFVTGDDVSKAINNASWNLAANGTAGSEKIKPNNTVTFNAGKNMEVVRDGANITYATKDDVNFNSVQLGDNGPTINNSNGAVNVNGAKITGVAAGDITPNSTDAVNGSQIYALTGGNTINYNTDGSTTSTVTSKDQDGNSVTKTYSLTTYNVEGQTEFVTNSVVTAVHNMNEQGIKFFHTNDDVVKPINQANNTVDSSASGAYATAVGYQAKASGTNAVAMGKGSQALGSNTIAIGTGNVVEASNSGAFGDPNIINGTTVDNVAVSGSYAIGNNNIINSSNTFVLGNNVNNAGNSTAMGSTVANSIYLGNQTTATGGDGSATGTLRNLDVNGNRGATTTAGSTGTVSQAVVGNLTYGGFAGATANGVVSVGAAGSERRIQNVAAGEISATSTDAINGSQLYSVAKGMGDLDNKVNRNNKDLRAGIAGANAAAGLPQVYLPGKSMVAASAGTFKGQNAVAVGYSRASDNGKVIFKLQGNANTRGDVGGSVGVGYQW